MPLPRWLGRLNRRVTNPVLWPVLSHVPGYARVVHRGRRTGRVHRTPILAFRHGDRLVVALTYGPGTEWVHNVLAAGRATLESRAGRLELSEPRLVHDPARRDVPRLIRLVLRLLGAADFLELRVGALPAPNPNETAMSRRWN